MSEIQSTLRAVTDRTHNLIFLDFLYYPVHDAIGAGKERGRKSTRGAVDRVLVTDTSGFVRYGFKSTPQCKYMIQLTGKTRGGERE